MHFDFIIVGAGSAGCVLANRLTACGRYTVALVEAGSSDSSFWIHLPIGYFKTMGNPSFDWCYKTEVDPGIANRSIPWPRGKVLGGSSSINGLLFVRGQSRDFNHWRDLGNQGWSWDDVLPYFKKLENWEDPDNMNNKIFRGFGGPINVSSMRVKRSIVDAWIEAAVNAGYRKNEDYNGEFQDGVGYFQQTAKLGRRCSSAVAYLDSIKNRKNLKIFKNTMATKILIKDDSVKGIELKKKDQIFARKEVILSAGTIGSPQLLMLSGIGPVNRLNNVGIQVLKNLNGVGKNLQDHLQARPVFKCTSSTLNTEVKNFVRLMAMGSNYFLKKQGPLTLAASLGVGFLRTEEKLKLPDIQFHIQPFSMDRPSLDSMHKFNGFTTSVLQLRPESSGEIYLQSRDINVHPKIIPNYLSTQKDCDVLVKGFKIARKIAKFEPLKSLIISEHAPGLDIEENDDDSILDWVRKTAVTIYHPTGTCKMGSGEDAVVDNRLRVRGIEGLRIVDASIMPKITSGNTNAPTLMIGEKGASMIIEDALK